MCTTKFFNPELKSSPAYSLSCLLLIYLKVTYRTTLNVHYRSIWFPSHSGHMGGKKRPGIDCLCVRDHFQKNLGIRLRLECGVLSNAAHSSASYSWTMSVRLTSWDGIGRYTSGLFTVGCKSLTLSFVGSFAGILYSYGFKISKLINFWQWPLHIKLPSKDVKAYVKATGNYMILCATVGMQI